MSDVQLYIDPYCRLSKVPYKVPNNTHYVTLEDYERLKYKSACQTECLDAYDKKLNEANAEVERLRKAGDALEQEVIGCYFEQDDPADSESLRAWRAAKEGKQS